MTAWASRFTPETRLTRIEIRDGGSSVAVMLKSGAVVEAAKALVGVGRTWRRRILDCAAAGIATSERGGIVVDEDLRTSQPHILAAGDVTGRMLLAHAASYMGEFAGRPAAGQSFSPVPYHSIPGRHSPPRRSRRSACPWRRRASGAELHAASVPLMDNVKARIDRTTEGSSRSSPRRDGQDRRRNDRRASCLGHDPHHCVGGPQGDDRRGDARVFLCSPEHFGVNRRFDMHRLNSK